jgi:Tol biopolymer transport system component
MFTRSNRLAAVAIAASTVLIGAVGVAPAQARNDPKFVATHSYFVWTRVNSTGGGAPLVIDNGGRHHIRQLTHPGDGVFDVNARLSPNGRWVLFERDFPDRSAAGLVRIDGAGERLLNVRCTGTCVGVNAPTWTPDGEHVLYDRVSGPFDSSGNAATASLWKSDLRGGPQTRFSDPALDPTTEETDASFTPDGHVIVVRALRDLRTAVWRLNSDGTHPQQLTPYAINADLPQASPHRSGPSAGLVVFETFGHGVAPGASEGPSIATVPSACVSLADCTARIRYLTSRAALPVRNFNPAWSPAGKQVVFVHAELDLDTPVGDIYRVSSTGGTQTPVSTDPRFEFRPAWGTIHPRSRDAAALAKASKLGQSGATRRR